MPLNSPTDPHPNPPMPHPKWSLDKAATHLAELNRLPASVNLIIHGRQLVGNPIRKAVGEAILPPGAKSWAKVDPDGPSDPENVDPEKDAKRKKLYFRSRWTYEGKRRVASEMYGYARHGDPDDYQAVNIEEAARYFTRAACCRLPGLLRDGDEAAVRLIKRTCDMPYLCPFCCYRKMLCYRYQATHGPAHEMAAALDQGHTLYHMRFQVTGANFEYARAFRELLHTRLRKTIKPEAYWISLTPHVPSLDDRQLDKPEAASNRFGPSYAIRVVTAGAPYTTFRRKWHKFEREWQLPKLAMPAEHGEINAQHRLKGAIARLGRLSRNLTNPNSPWAHRVGYVNMLPRGDRRLQMLVHRVSPEIEVQAVKLAKAEQHAAA